MRRETEQTNNMKSGNKIHTAVFISEDESNLQSLLDAVAEGIIKNADISLIIASSSNTSSLSFAADDKIPTAVIPPRSLDESDSEETVLSYLEKFGIELIVLDSFHYDLGSLITEKYADRIISIHPSLMPAFCDPVLHSEDIHRAVLEYGCKVTGATVFYPQRKGPEKIILQKSLAIRNNDTPHSLSHRVRVSVEWEILPRSVELVAKELLSR